MASLTAEQKTKFDELCNMSYKNQTIWFLNGFWGEGVDSKEANKIWDYLQKFAELDNMSDTKKGLEGTSLDVFWSAKFLEEFNQTLPAIQRKEALRTIDANNDGRTSILEYLLWHYKKTVPQCVVAPQGTGNPEKLKAAQEALKKVQLSLEKTKQLAAELQAALAELKRQEDEYNKTCKNLEAKINDPKSSVVQRSRASNELAQLKAEDPLPLRKAKITQEAALRKCQRQEEQLMKDLEAAQLELEAAKKDGGVAPGMIWMMQRELFEGDKYLPNAKQKFDHKKPFDFDPLA